MTVALNKPEILHRAHGFVKDYADARNEMGKAQNFIRGLCDVFGFSSCNCLRPLGFAIS